MNAANQTYGGGFPLSHGETDPRPLEPLQRAPNPFANLPSCFPALRGGYAELFREAGRLRGTSQKCKELQSRWLQSEQPARPELPLVVFPVLAVSKF